MDTSFYPYFLHNRAISAAESEVVMQRCVGVWKQWIIAFVGRLSSQSVAMLASASLGLLMAGQGFAQSAGAARNAAASARAAASAPQPAASAPVQPPVLVVATTATAVALPFVNSESADAVAAEIAAAQRTRRHAQFTVAGMQSRMYLPPTRGIRAVRTQPTAVILLGGTDGQLIMADLTGPQLAEAGYLSLGLHYHDGWGGSKKLTGIDIEPFFEAVKWLGEQKGVQRVVVLGESRGAEAAILTGLAAARADRAQPPAPHKLAGIVAYVPSAYVQPGVGPTPNDLVPSWRFRGQNFPTLPIFKMPTFSSENLLKAIAAAPKADIDAAELPVEAVNVPMLVLGADADRIWPSGEFSRRIAARAKANGKDANLRVVVYPQSGHRLLGTGPSAPSQTYRWDGGSFTANYGGTEAGNQAARDAAWEELLCFLAQCTPKPGN